MEFRELLTQKESDQKILFLSSCPTHFLSPRSFLEQPATHRRNQVLQILMLFESLAYAIWNGP